MIFNGVNIETQLIVEGGNSLYVFEGIFSEAMLDFNIGTPGFLNFDLNMLVNVYLLGYPFGNSIENFEIPVQVVSFDDNQVYSIISSTNDIMRDWENIIVPNDCDLSYGYKCCTGKKIINWRVDQNMTITNSSTDTYSLNNTFEVSVNMTGLSYTGQLQYTTEVSNVLAFTNVELFRQEDVFILEPSSSPWDCMAPVPVIFLRKYVKTDYLPNCNGFDIAQPNPTDIWVPDQLDWEYCYFNLNPEAPACPEMPIPEINKTIGNELISQVDPCKGLIEILNYNINQEYEITWNGPDGFISNDFNIYDLEIGTYAYEITNTCCDVIEGDISLCDNTVPSAWYKDGENWCRTLTCQVSDPTSLQYTSLLDCISYECVEPDEIIDVENQNGDCIRHYYYNSEILGTEEIQVLEEVMYNIQSGMCQMVKMCGESSNEIIEENPVFGVVSFDYFSEKCIKAIFCFDEVMEETFVEQPVITEELNDLTGLCDRKAYCDNIPYVLPPVFPILNTPFNWNEFSGCTKQVKCSINSVLTTVTIPPTYDNWDYNEFSNQCQADVFCDGQQVFGQTHYEFTTGKGEWELIDVGPNGNEACSREIYCQSFNTTVIEYGIASWHISVPNPGCNGSIGNDLYWLKCNNEPTLINKCINNALIPQKPKKQDENGIPSILTLLIQQHLL